MPSHKDTNAFIRKWNKEFSIKGYSKMNIAEKNKLVEQKVKSLLKEKSIGNYKQIQEEWSKLKETDKTTTTVKKSSPPKIERKTYYVEIEDMTKKEVKEAEKDGWNLYKKKDNKFFLRRKMTKQDANTDVIWEARASYEKSSIDKKLQ